MKIIEGHEKDYHLKCKIKILDHYYTELSDGKRHATTSAFLVPDVDATETSRFLDAWLPEIGTICLDCHESADIDHLKCPKCGSEKLKTEHTECPTWLAAPVSSSCRMAVMRKNKRLHHHHLFVMNKGVEEDLRSMNGKVIEVHVFPAAQDAMCDSAKDINRTVK